jgi:hypothetical protein
MTLTISPTESRTITTTLPSSQSNTLPYTPIPVSETSTPLPTFTLEQARSYVLDLLNTNGNCRLPCWWGIIPGHTNWQEASRVLKTFSIHFSVYPIQDGLYAEVSFPTPMEVPYAYELFQSYLIIDDVVQEIEVYNYDFASHYYLPEFLKTYGQPEEIWIRTEQPGVRSSGPFELVLFYPSQGILMNTPGGDGSIEGNIIRNCLRNMNWPFLYLWSPEQQKTFIEAEQQYLTYPDSTFFLSLFEATGMTVEEFYENFIDPETAVCLETPLDLWP